MRYWNIPAIDLDPRNVPVFIPREKVNENEKWIKHVRCDGARFHVLSWLLVKNIDGTTRVDVRCNDPDCIYNKGAK